MSKNQDYSNLKNNTSDICEECEAKKHRIIVKESVKVSDSYTIKCDACVYALDDDNTFGECDCETFPPEYEEKNIQIFLCEDCDLELIKDKYSNHFPECKNCLEPIFDKKDLNDTKESGKVYCWSCTNDQYGKIIEQHENEYMGFGKHKDLTFLKVYNQYPDYVDWCCNLKHKNSRLYQFYLYCQAKKGLGF